MVPSKCRRPFDSRRVSADRMSHTTARVRASRIHAAAGHVVCWSSCQWRSSRSRSRSGHGSAATAEMVSAWGALRMKALTRYCCGERSWISTRAGAWGGACMTANKRARVMAVLTGCGGPWFLAGQGHRMAIGCKDVDDPAFTLLEPVQLAALAGLQRNRRPDLPRDDQRSTIREASKVDPSADELNRHPPFEPRVGVLEPAQLGAGAIQPLDAVDIRQLAFAD